jgi:MerR family transcriptional regulator, copper efflux regulator
MSKLEKKEFNLKDFLNINEAAELMGVDKMTLRRWDNIGKLKAYRNPMNKYRLYKREELETLLKEILSK